MRDSFEAEIKEKKERIDVDGCMSGRMIIEYTPSAELRHELVEIFNAGSTILVTLENEDELPEEGEE